MEVRSTVTSQIDAHEAQAGRGRNLGIIAVAFLVTVPWIVLHLQGAHPPPLTMAALSGLAILGAAFLLSWAAEVFQMDVSQAFALALLALIAVLPEYAVDARLRISGGSGSGRRPARLRSREYDRRQPAR